MKFMCLSWDGIEILISPVRAKNKLKCVRILQNLNISALKWQFFVHFSHIFGEEVVSQNLLCFWQKTRFTNLLPPADFCAKGPQYWRFFAHGLILTDHAKPSLWQKLCPPPNIDAGATTILSFILRTAINTKHSRCNVINYPIRVVPTYSEQIVVFIYLCYLWGGGKGALGCSCVYLCEQGFQKYHLKIPSNLTP